MIGKIFVILCLIGTTVASRFFLPDGPNYTGSASGTSTYIGYLIEDLGLAIACLAYFRGYFSRTAIKRNKIALFWLAFYLYVPVTIYFADNAVTILHMSFRGIAYVFVGLLASAYIQESKYGIDDALKMYFYIIFLGSTVTVIVQTITVASYDYLITSGAGGGVVALFGLLAMYASRYAESRKVNSVKLFRFIGRGLLFCLFLYLVVRMNSISSILGFLAGLAVMFFVRKKYLNSLLLMLLVGFAVPALVDKFQDEEFEIARKDLTTITEGTGRFGTWEYCWEEFSSGRTNLLGHGFMNDAAIMVGNNSLVLTHSCHSSPLSLLIGLGYVGLVFYIYFLLIHIKVMFTARGTRLSRELIIISYVSMIFYGIGSPMFPGTASYLIAISVTLCALNIFEKKTGT